MTTYITTSWDDGHPLDFRIAELLHKFRLHGTFYVPMKAENVTMTTSQIRELSREFEIGAHTLRHTVLTTVSNDAARREIEESKSWIENCTGAPCVMFCPPRGKYRQAHAKMVWAAGYLGLRTVELGSLDAPRRHGEGVLVPTTVQAYPHTTSALLVNGIKRMAFRNLWRLATHGRTNDWQARAQNYLREALSRGGVFHLWGHSWELQETGQWRRVEDVFKIVRELADEAQSLTNGELGRRVLSESSHSARRVRARAA
jgi:peptidoglycan-N-acetylglucosamine deacetylase